MWKKYKAEIKVDPFTTLIIMGRITSAQAIAILHYAKENNLA